MTSVSAGALPLYGTWRALSCAIELNSSATRCAVAPVPDEAKVYLSGLLRTSWTNSRASLAGKLAFVTRANGARAIRLTGTKSFSGSYGVFCRFGMIEIGPLEVASSVEPSRTLFAHDSEPSERA